MKHDLGKIYITQHLFSNKEKSVSKRNCLKIGLIAGKEMDSGNI